MPRINGIYEDDEAFQCTQGCPSDELGDLWQSDGYLFHNHNGEQHEVVLHDLSVETAQCGTREKGDDDGVEYADPRDEREERLKEDL